MRTAPALHRTYKRSIILRLLPIIFIAITCLLVQAQQPRSEDIPIIPEPISIPLTPPGFQAELYQLDEFVEFVPRISRLDYSVPNRFDKRNNSTSKKIEDYLRVRMSPELWQQSASLPEIANLLSWLRRNILMPLRIIIIISPIDAMQLKDITTGRGLLSRSEMNILLKSNTNKSEFVCALLQGFEGQLMGLNPAEEEIITQDIDVSGAVFAPVKEVESKGMGVIATGVRTPDLQAVAIDLKLEYVKDYQKRAVRILLGDDQGMQEPATNDTAEKDAKTNEALIGGPITSGYHYDLELLSRVVGRLETATVIPLNKFQLVGTLDFGMADNTLAGRKLGVFLCAQPTEIKPEPLSKISFLKAGEEIHCIPTGFLESMQRIRVTRLFNPGFYLMSQELCQYTIRPFSDLKSNFSNITEGNIKVLPIGPLLLSQGSHDSQKKITDQLLVKNGNSPLAARVVVLVVSADLLFDLILTKVYSEEQVTKFMQQTDVSILMDTSLNLRPRQNAITYAGLVSDFIPSYEILGDTHDPMVISYIEQGYVMDLYCGALTADKHIPMKIKFLACPYVAKVQKKEMKSPTIMTGSTVTYLHSMSGPMEGIKRGLVNFEHQFEAIPGKYTLVGASPMPIKPDGKADPRHSVLFIRVDQ